MNLLCAMVGHKPPVYAEKGWYSPGQEYGHLSNFATDGIRRVHAHVIGECARCGKKFTVARVHLPTGERVTQFENSNYGPWQEERRQRKEEKRRRDEVLHDDICAFHSGHPCNCPQAVLKEA